MHLCNEQKVFAENSEESYCVCLFPSCMLHILSYFHFICCMCKKFNFHKNNNNSRKYLVKFSYIHGTMKFDGVVFKKKKFNSIENPSMYVSEIATSTCWVVEGERESFLNCPPTFYATFYTKRMKIIIFYFITTSIIDRSGVCVCVFSKDV